MGVSDGRGVSDRRNKREIQMTRSALPGYHMIIHALQTVLHLNKKYLCDVHLPRIQSPILIISYSNGVPSAKHV